MIFELPVNYAAVLAAAVAAFVFGFLVHGPLFGKTWMRLMKITPEEMERGKHDMQKKMPVYMLVAFLQHLVIAFVFALFVETLGVADVSGAFLLAFLAWLGFIATVHLNTVLWEKRTVPLYAFNVAYHLAGLAIIALILALWR